MAITSAHPLSNIPASKRLKRRAALRWRALFLCLALSAPPLIATCAARADQFGDTTAMVASARIDAITCSLAALHNAGAIQDDLYVVLFTRRTVAHELVLRWLHAGIGRWEATAALAELEREVEGVIE